MGTLQAIQDCSCALVLGPDAPTLVKALMSRGLAHEQTESYDSSAADLKAVLALHPQHWQVRVLSGMISRLCVLCCSAAQRLADAL